MLTLVVTLHVIIALFLIVFVLLQDSKGGAMGALTGGGSNTFFGATGASSFLVKATRAAAILFAVTCVSLAYLSSPDKSSVTEGRLAPGVENEIETAAPPKATEEPQTEGTESKDQEPPKSK